MCYYMFVLSWCTGHGRLIYDKTVSFICQIEISSKLYSNQNHYLARSKHLSHHILQISFKTYLTQGPMDTFPGDAFIFVCI